MLALFALAFALAMDAFAVSLVRGCTGDRSWLRAIELGLIFGLAQGLMPLLGWAVGEAFGSSFRSFDHWIAFLLLSLLGGRMAFEALSKGEPTNVGHHGRWLGLLTAAFATSIDAAAAGLTLPLFGIWLPTACLIIGATTAFLCAFGYLAASFVGVRAGKAAELLGGLVLIALGLRILVTHLFE